MLMIGATRLKYPNIRYGNKSVPVAEDRAKWNLANVAFLKTNRHTVAYGIMSDSSVRPDHVEGFRKGFETQLESCQVGTPQQIQLRTGGIRIDHSTSYIGDIRDCFRKAKQQRANLVILVLQSSNQDVYSSFKYLADRVFGISSIVMVARSNFRSGSWNPGGLNQYIGNIMMKANLKMGGINHLAESRDGNIGRWLSNTLVLGADVTHPSNGALLGCPSVAALVGSVESTGGRFLDSLSLQSKGKKEASSPTCFLHIR
jgi:eukaryotic translation initiation factor 2C